MKKYFIIAVMVMAGVCKAQTIYPLFGDPANFNIPGSYYKDTFNDFNNFTGTWLYTNGTTSFKIVIQEKLQYYNTENNIYEDMIIGGYQYIENGVEKVNTLNQLLSNDPEVYNYSIMGNIINTASHYPLCAECPPEQKRLLLSFKDPTRTADINLYGEIILRRVDSGGVQKIELWLRQRGNIVYIDGTTPPYTSFNIPWDKYVLTKVE